MDLTVVQRDSIPGLQADSPALGLCDRLDFFGDVFSLLVDFDAVELGTACDWASLFHARTDAASECSGCWQTMPSRMEEKHEVLNLGVGKCFPRLRELLEHALYGSLELGSGGTAVSAVADVLATASLGCGHTFCGA